MKWLLWRRHDTGAREARERAERELAQAERDLERMRQEGRAVRELAASLRDLRERNHFGDVIVHIARRGQT